MTTAPLESVPFVELLRQPTETTERLSRTRALRLRRRDAADLVLVEADRAATEAEVIEVMARIHTARPRKAASRSASVASEGADVGSPNDFPSPRGMTGTESNSARACATSSRSRSVD